MRHVSSGTLSLPGPVTSDQKDLPLIYSAKGPLADQLNQLIWRHRDPGFGSLALYSLLHLLGRSASPLLGRVLRASPEVGRRFEILAARHLRKAAWESVATVALGLTR